MVTDSGMRWVHAVRRCWGLGYGKSSALSFTQSLSLVPRTARPTQSERTEVCISRHVSSARLARLAQRSGRVYSVSLRVDRSARCSAATVRVSRRTRYLRYYVTFDSERGTRNGTCSPDPPAAARRRRCAMRPDRTRAAGHETGRAIENARHRTPCVQPSYAEVATTVHNMVRNCTTPARQP